MVPHCYLQMTGAVLGEGTDTVNVCVSTMGLQPALPSDGLTASTGVSFLVLSSLKVSGECFLFCP